MINVPSHKGLLKIGYTSRNSKDRIAEQLRTSGVIIKLFFEEEAIRADGSVFTDHEVHDYLRKKNIKNWTVNGLAVLLTKLKMLCLQLKVMGTHEHRTQTFEMRPEQEEAVRKTANYFTNFKSENSNKTPCISFEC